MVVHYGISEQPAAVGRWSQTLVELRGRIAHRFARSEVRECSRLPTAFSDGLLARLWPFVSERGRVRSRHQLAQKR